MSSSVEHFNRLYYHIISVHTRLIIYVKNFANIHVGENYSFVVTMIDNDLLFTKITVSHVFSMLHVAELLSR